MLRSLVLIAIFTISFFNFAPGAKAHNSNRGLAITGVALGGTALALGAYNAYQNHRIRRGDFYTRRSPRRFHRRRHYRNTRPVYYRNHRNCGASPFYY